MKFNKITSNFKKLNSIQLTKKLIKLNFKQLNSIKF